MTHILGIRCSSLLQLTMLQIQILTLSVHWAFGTQVTETRAEYPCAEMALQYDVVAGFADNNKTQCEQLWSLNKRTFATYADGEVGCHEPCIMVHSGNIRLRTCANVTLTVLCRFQFLEESRIHFTGRVYQSPVAIATELPHQEGTRNRHYGFLVAAVIVLLIVAILGLVWRALKNRRTSSTVVHL